MTRLAALSVAVGLALTGARATSAQRATNTVVLIVSDGLRWQEVMTGADSTLLGEHGGNWESTAQLRTKFWNDDVAKRRAMLMPFFWTVVAKQGQVFGDRALGNVARVTNGYGFSYPGYNEMLTGRADARINSNEFGPNPDTTVFEWLNAMKPYHGRVDVYATWATFKDIFNIPRSHLAIQAGWDLPPHAQHTPRDALLDSLFRITTKLDETDLTNSFLQIPLIDMVRTGAPRVLFVGYGETDNWAHSGRYDLVLESAHQMDAFVQQLWTVMQSMPEYRGHTTFIITADHGRGSGLEDWKHHGEQYPGSEDIWIGVIGPDTPALGPRSGPLVITQSQIAATIAALLGEDYRKFSPLAAAPLPVFAISR